MPSGPRQPPLLQDYIKFSVTAPPAEFGLDPFYKKYVDAHGIPVVTSDKVHDAALLAARDIVQLMLANRPDLRKELSQKNGSSRSWHDVERERRALRHGHVLIAGRAWCEARSMRKPLPLAGVFRPCIIRLYRTAYSLVEDFVTIEEQWPGVMNKLLTNRIPWTDHKTWFDSRGTGIKSTLEINA